MKAEQRDEEIVGLLITLGKSRKEAWRQLAGTRDKPALLKRLKEEKRVEDFRFERERNKGRLAGYAQRGRENLADALLGARNEQRLGSRQRPALERLAHAWGRMRFAEAGPVKAHMVSPTAGRSDHADPTSAGYASSVCDGWDLLIGRLADCCEHELALMEGDATVLAARSSEFRDRRILAMLGEPVNFIAYVEDVSVRHISDLCRRRRDGGENYRLRAGRLVLELEMEEAA